MRAVGEVTGDMENVLLKMYDDISLYPMLHTYLLELSLDHDLQHGEVLGLIFTWLNIHIPGAKPFHISVLRYAYEWIKLNFPEQAEEYTAGGKPDLPKLFGFKEKQNERRSNSRAKNKS